MKFLLIILLSALLFSCGQFITEKPLIEFDEEDTLSQFSKIDTVQLIDKINILYNGDKINFSKLENYIENQKPELIIIEVTRDLPVDYLRDVLVISEKLDVKVRISTDN